MRSRGGVEQPKEEFDLASDPWLLVMNMAAFDGSDGFYPCEGRFGWSQRSQALAVSEQPFHRGMVAFDKVVAPLSVDMPDAFDMRVIPMIDVPDDASIGMGFSRANRDRAVQPHTLNRLV